MSRSQNRPPDTPLSTASGQNSRPIPKGVRITSSTHAPHDLPGALVELGKLVQARDDDFFRKKGFDSAADFAGKIKALSAVVVKTDWHSIHGEQPRNYVWLNSVATVLLSADVVDHLRSM